MKEYKESQSFMTLWLVVLFLALFGIEFYSIVKDYQVDQSINLTVGFWILFVVMLAMFLMRLRLQVNREGIVLRFLPFVIRKHWKWEDIDKVFITEYSLLDYGGWGYRIGKKGIAYTTKGKYGLQIVLKNGKSFLIGTQNPKELESFISQCFIN